MRQRLSISRLMVTIGLLGLSMTLIKSWVGPKNSFGFLGLMGWMVLNYWIAAYVTNHKARRFFIGAGISGTILLIADFVSPSTILRYSWRGLSFPLIRVFGSLSDLNHYQYQWYWVETMLRPDSYFEHGFWGWLQIRSSMAIGYPDVQVLLLLPQTVLALLGGLIATFSRPKSGRPTESPTT